MVFVRNPHNPLITPAHMKPSRPDFEVIGAFNAGVARCGDEVILLIRVAERPINHDPAWVAFPFMAVDGEVTVRLAARTNGRYDLTDSRLIVDLQNKQTMLTSISHIRLARSRDGIHFDFEDHAWLAPTSPYETYGVEDARI